MPRILSQSNFQRQKRRNSMNGRVSRTLSQESVQSSEWSMRALFGGPSRASSTEYITRVSADGTPSLVSSTSSTPMSLDLSQPSATDLSSIMRKHASPTKESGQLKSAESNDSDTWGQFVEVQEAEEAIVRASHLLSGRRHRRSSI